MYTTQLDAYRNIMTVISNCRRNCVPKRFGNSYLNLYGWLQPYSSPMINMLCTYSRILENIKKWYHQTYGTRNQKTWKRYILYTTIYLTFD